MHCEYENDDIAHGDSLTISQNYVHDRSQTRDKWHVWMHSENVAHIGLGNGDGYKGNSDSHKDGDAG
jgi:hypothetical protein